MVAALVLAMALSGCGRKGDPLPPPDPNAPTPQASSGANPSDSFGRPSNPPIQKPDRPFLLDPLIKSQ